MARELENITNITQDVLDNFAMNVWKVCPWRARNREWLCVLFQAYFACIFASFLMACVLNSLEGQKWRDDFHGDGVHAVGSSALDECFWFVFTTMHGIAFGEFMPRGAPGRIIAMGCCSMGYWFVIFMCCIVMFSQLPGEKTPSLYSTLSRMISAVWPSYIVFIAIICIVGAQCGPYVSNDRDGRNEWPTGIYWMWTTAHRMPYGDLWPETTIGRCVTVPTAILGLLYMPYTMALVAVRCPSMAQHEALLGELKKHPEDSFGRGYEVPDAAMSPARGGHTEMATLASGTA